jgi:hypothetical protein
MFFFTKNTFLPKIKKIFNYFLYTLFFLIFIWFIVNENKLFIHKSISNSSNFMGDWLIGEKSTSVRSFSDFKVFLSGVVENYMQPEIFPSLDLKIKHKNLVNLSSNLKKGNFRKYWAPVELDFSSETLKESVKGRVRFKGDRAIHREGQNLMSYRVNLKGKDRVFGLEEFSIQRPVTRGYTWELLISKIFKKENLLTLSSSMVDFTVNGDSRGLYVIEEIPSEITVEKQMRKSGPIFSLEESFGTTVDTLLDVYEKKKWKEEKLYLTASSLLYEEFNKAKNGLPFSSDSFDMDEWAKFFALHDLFSSYHGTLAKSTKFYFNPVQGKIQPILFDAHKGSAEFKNFITLDLITSPEIVKCDWMCDYTAFHKAFLRNKDFLKKYIDALKVISSQKFIDEISIIYDRNFKSIDNALYSKLSVSNRIDARGYGLYLFKKNEINKRASLIRNKLLIAKTSKNLGEIDISKDIVKEIDVIEIQNLNLRGDFWKFKKDTVLILRGRTEIYGSKEDPFRFIGPVMIVQRGGEMVFKNVVMDGGKSIPMKKFTWSGALNIINSTVFMKGVTIKNNISEDAINLVSSNFEIEDISIENSFSDALDSDFSKGSIVSIACVNIGNDCLDTSESKVFVESITGRQVKDKVVSAGERSNLSIINVLINDAGIGVVSKDESQLTIQRMLINNTPLALAAFTKKPEYKEAKLFVNEVITSEGEELIGVFSKKANIQIPSSVNSSFTSSKKVESKMYGVLYGVKTNK